MVSSAKTQPKPAPLAALKSETAKLRGQVGSILPRAGQFSKVKGSTSCSSNAFTDMDTQTNTKTMGNDISVRIWGPKTLSDYAAVRTGGQKYIERSAAITVVRRCRSACQFLMGPAASSPLSREMAVVRGSCDRSQPRRWKASRTSRRQNVC